MKDNLLTQYSLRVYSQNGIEPLLLDLQDGQDADINMILCCCWLGQRGQQLTDEQVFQLDQESASWRVNCILPLRSVRRYLKGQQSDDFRLQVKTLELQAELKQQQMLFEQVNLMDTLVMESHEPATTILNNIKCYLINALGIEWNDVDASVKKLINKLMANNNT